MSAICTAAILGLPEESTIDEGLDAGWLTVYPSGLHSAKRLLAGEVGLLATIEVASLTAGGAEARSGEDRYC